MIEISTLYAGASSRAAELRYPKHSPTDAQAPAVVVFNCTRRCNLRCVHCYSNSGPGVAGEGELDTAAAEELIDELARIGVRVLLLSGGEPLMREDICELTARAVKAGLRVALSTNGVAMSRTRADRLRGAGLSYAGISLDGVGKQNDVFRGRQGAFDDALAGLRHCRQAGIKVGLRFTMTRQNTDQIPSIFELAEAEGIERLCFYHLVPTGRGHELTEQMLDPAQTRREIDRILDRTLRLCQKNGRARVLTVDNHADGPYLILRLQAQGREDESRRAVDLLKISGGNKSGERIACVRWNGDVLPDQFSETQVLGNVRDQPFGRIWNNPQNPLRRQLRDRRHWITGRCRRCRWMDICNGNLRARAAAAGDLWGNDPACYLTEEEIAP